ncbi:hypothetical protein [Burkholderia phage BCSR5]|nr:hypothetical protein [Burkholderia phage BCSR5]
MTFYLTKEKVMSRTVKGSKAPGFQYWSKRPVKGETRASPGAHKFTKKLTHRAERRQGRKECKEG